VYVVLPLRMRALPTSQANGPLPCWLTVMVEPDFGEIVPFDLDLAAGAQRSCRRREW
jgi:hypothetical protein